jgi:LysR family transcriptional regulator, glycine cleavage system transcriptional activator
VLRFNQYDQVIQAALAGQGIALGRLALVGPLIADGRLAVIGGSAPELKLGYWLYAADPSPRTDVLAVRDWIRAEARACEAAPSPV